MSNIFVVVSVDWEGLSLLPENIEKMVSFRRHHPDVPMQQFLNAAYYTKENANAVETTEIIFSTLLDSDEHGLHLHGWKSLFETSGVTVKTEPCLIPEENAGYRSDAGTDFYQNDWGYDVPVNRYAKEELLSVLNTSVSILAEHGFRKPESFRAGAWMGGSSVQAALAMGGWKLDASAVNSSFVRKRFGDLPVSRWVEELWPDINDISQPFEITNQHGVIWEVPNNGCLADYTTAEEMFSTFKNNVELWGRMSRKKDVYISIGFHQESAFKHLDRVNDAVVMMKNLAGKNNLPLRFIGNPILYLG